MTAGGVTAAVTVGKVTAAVTAAVTAGKVTAGKQD